MTGRACLLGTGLFALLWMNGCAPRAREAAALASARVVLSPSAVVALSRDSNGRLLPAQISFGSAHGRSALYLKFDDHFATRGEPLQAFIALSPRALAPASGEHVVLEAWRVRDPWQPEELVTWADQPPLAPPYAQAELESESGVEQRIEVTELVRFAAARPDLDFGIALLGRGGEGHGITFATGEDGGSAPRLEVYLP